tara:strand:+ start:124 stop:411 length:288 start_codon:yes stop_codon:yes gene_type:complete
MFEDFRTVPLLMAILWTAVMFWITLAWTVYAIVSNSNLKTVEALKSGVSGFNKLPDSRRNIIKKLCRNRLLSPFKIWLKGLLLIFLFEIFVFVLY